jgi:hypothetical protein
MVKEPVPGRVKTRLGREIGMTEAAWWFRHQTRDLLRRLRDPRWEIVLCVSPDKPGMESRFWPRDLRRIPQGEGDLGARMARMLGCTPGPTVLIGADILGITGDHIARAFRSLGSARSVLGPATDGGFWLVGLRFTQRPPSGIFESVRWSHADTMKDAIGKLPHPVAFIDTLSDVDTAADLARVRRPRALCRE